MVAVTESISHKPVVQFAKQVHSRPKAKAVKHVPTTVIHQLAELAHAVDAHQEPKQTQHIQSVNRVNLASSQLEIQLVNNVQVVHSLQSLELLLVIHASAVMKSMASKLDAIFADLVNSQITDQLVNNVHPTLTQLIQVLVNVKGVLQALKSTVLVRVVICAPLVGTLLMALNANNAHLECIPTIKVLLNAGHASVAMK